MARNRKRQVAVRFGPVLAAVLAVSVITGVALGYVYQKNQIYELGQQIKKRELRLEELQRQNKLRRDHLAYLRSPGMLDARVKELNLGLVEPQAGHVVRLVEPPPVETLPGAARLYADEKTHRTAAP